MTGSPCSNSIVTRSVVLRDADALAVEMDRVRPLAPDRVEQHGVQIAAVEHHVGKAVALDRDRAEIEQLPGLAGAPEPDLLAGDDDAEPLGRRAEPQRIEHAGAVRADLDAGAELLQLGRLLIDIDADALPDQRQRRGQSADAGADDGNVLFFSALARHSVMPGTCAGHPRLNTLSEPRGLDTADADDDASHGGSAFACILLAAGLVLSASSPASVAILSGKTDQADRAVRRRRPGRRHGRAWWRRSCPPASAP